MRPRQLLVFLLLLCATAGSGIGVAQQSQSVRTLHSELELLRRERDRLLAEYSRLLLERGALAAYQNVESVAEQQLAMRFPETARHLEP